MTSLPESVHPVRRAEAAFELLGRVDEFRAYYEQNRFGDVKIGSTDNKPDVDGDKADARSYLSSLTGDDVSMGTDRNFFAKSMPHLCASVVGFSAVEAALELGNVNDDTDQEATNSSRADAAAQATEKRDNSEQKLSQQSNSPPGAGAPDYSVQHFTLFVKSGAQAKLLSLYLVRLFEFYLEPV